MAREAGATRGTATGAGEKRELVRVTTDALVIKELDVRGAAFGAARHGVAQGRNPEEVVRQILDVGGTVLLHGVSGGVIEGVGREVDRLLAELDSRRSSLAAVRALAARTAAKGFGYEDLVEPVVSRCFKPFL